MRLSKAFDTRPRFVAKWTGIWLLVGISIGVIIAILPPRGADLSFVSGIISILLLLAPLPISIAVLTAMIDDRYRQLHGGNSTDSAE